MIREYRSSLFPLLTFIILLTACQQGSPALPSALPPIANTPTRSSVPDGTTPLPTAPPPITAPSPAPSPSSGIVMPLVQQHFTLNALPGIGRAPFAMISLGDTLYVVNARTNNVAVIQKNRVLKFIPVGKRPGAIAADPLQKRLYVANVEDKSVSIITVDAVALTQTLGEEPSALLFFENHLFVGLGNKALILVLDPATLKTQATIPLAKGFDVSNLAGDAVHHRVYATPYERLAVIDSTNLRVLTILDTKGSSFTLLPNPANDSILVTAYDSKTNSQYLTKNDPLSGAERGRALIGGDPHGAVMSGDGTRVYVANSYTNDVSIIDPRTMTPVATVPVDLQPYALSLDENAHRLYVANYSSDNVSVIDTGTNEVVGAIPLGMIPSALEANESAGRVYVASASTDSVYVVEGTRVVKEISVGRHPIDLARDEQSNRLLVANMADRTLSIIDESDFSVRATQPITRFLTTVAVDLARGRVFAGDVVLDLKTLSPINSLTMQGNTIGSQIAPDWVRVNPNNNRIYAVGWNGTPGSNSRQVTYSVDGSSLKQSSQMAYYGNTTALAFDPEMNRVFLAGTHPLLYTNELNVFDNADKKLLSLPIPGRTTGMLYNPQTHHLFLSQTAPYFSGYGATPTPADNTVQVLDTNSFGLVARLVMASPGKMARLGNTIYVANRDDGSLTLVQDTKAAIPPSPTPTLTLTPYPTLPPPTSTRVTTTGKITTTPRAAATIPACTIPVTVLASRVWTPQVAARIGCPTEPQHSPGFAFQPFERGVMYWREDEKRIYVLFADNTWSAFEDKWTDSLPEDTCPSISVPAGRVKPKRGFGKVWCEQSGVAAKIGAAIGNEAGGYVAPVQRFEHGLMMVSDSGQLFVLYADGKWE